MTIDADLLSHIPLFQKLDEDEKQSLANVMEVKVAKKGETLFRFGDLGDSLYIVREGEVDLVVRDHTGERVLLRKTGPGEMFGELSMLDNGPRTASAEVMEDTELLVLGQDDLLSFLSKRPDAAIDLLAALAGRIRKTNQLLMGRVSRNFNAEVEENLNWIEKIANIIARFGGSLSFLLINAVFFFSWIVANVGIIPGLPPFDPYPFGFLTMAVSLEAIFLSIFVLMAQNLQSTKERIRGNIEYEVNLKAELEILHLHEKVDIMNVDFLNRLHEIEKTVKRLGDSPKEK